MGMISLNHALSFFFGWAMAFAGLYLFILIGKILVNQSLHVSKGFIIGLLILKLSLWVVPIALLRSWKSVDATSVALGILTIVVSPIILIIKEKINARTS